MRTEIVVSAFRVGKALTPVRPREVRRSLPKDGQERRFRARQLLPAFASLALVASVLIAGTALAGPAVAAAPDASQGVSVLLTGSPGTPAFNPETGTVYVPIQCPKSYCPTSAPGRVVDVVNAATCNAQVQSGCHVVVTAPAGESPLAAAIDHKTDTVYLTDADGMVTVLDGARCNATVTSGCGQDLATIKVGGFLVDAVVDPMTKTLYVANPKGDVYVINIAQCSSLTTTGCGEPVKAVTDNNGPQAVDVDVATDTVYAADNGEGSNGGNGDTVSVINGASCNGTVSSGCASAPATVKVGSGASWVAVDQAHDTIYAANNNDGTVSVIDGSHCNGTVTSGCQSPAPAIYTGAGAAFPAVDELLHTVFTVNGADNTLSELNTSTCNSAVTSGCPHAALNERAAPDQAAEAASGANNVVLAPATNSAYLVNGGGPDVMSVVNVSHCQASDTSGCRVPVPSVPRAEARAIVDPATNTLYASNDNLAQIDVLDAATCNAGDLAGCDPVAKIPMAHPGGFVGGIDDATHTLYASDSGGSVSVINTATCNANDPAGCAGPWPSVEVGDDPDAPALDPATGTLYVPFGSKADEVAVVNAATCNAEVTSGCGQHPGVVAVGEGTYVLAVSDKTNTVYAPSTGVPFASGDTVSVINGATCNGTDFSGCGHLAATLTVGLGPYGVAVDDATNTVYVANNKNGDQPGTVSVINGATCNGSDTTGCSGNFPTFGVGRSPLLVAVDETTDKVYVTDSASAAVSVMNGSTCNAEVTDGCSVAAEKAMGSQPVGLAVDQPTGTVYALNSPQSGTMSILEG
jgi:DNA-binding beta-propeller fold protein YncE